MFLTRLKDFLPKLHFAHFSLAPHKDSSFVRVPILLCMYTSIYIRRRVEYAYTNSLEHFTINDIKFIYNLAYNYTNTRTLALKCVILSS